MWGHKHNWALYQAMIWRTSFNAVQCRLTERREGERAALSDAVISDANTASSGHCSHLPAWHAAFPALCAGNRNPNQIKGWQWGCANAADQILTRGHGWGSEVPKQQQELCSPGLAGHKKCLGCTKVITASNRRENKGKGVVRIWQWQP